MLALASNKENKVAPTAISTWVTIVHKVKQFIQWLKGWELKQPFILIYTHTHKPEFPNYITSVILDCVRQLENPERTQTQGERANSTQKIQWEKIDPTTFLL